MSTKMIEANVVSQNGHPVIHLVGEISAPAEGVLNQAYEEAVRENPSAVLLDFAGVDYINSTGIALILNLLVKAGRTHRRILAFGLSDHYREIFRITRLADFMRIYSDESGALASLTV